MGKTPSEQAVDNERINLFSRHYRLKYGEPVGKIALSLGRVCPNRRLGGCVYCAPASFTPFYLDGAASIAEQLAKGRRFLDSRKFRRYFAYFQQETTTAGPVDELAVAFRAVTAGPECLGLIVSTRPDSLPDAILEILAELAHGQGLEVLLELGLQSAHEETLCLINRNHGFAEFADAARRVKAAGLGLGVHLIVGLPGEGLAEMLATVAAVCDLGVEAIKFHHLQVIRGTRLAAMYEASPFPTLSPNDYLTILARLLARVPAPVVIHRLWSSSDPRLLVAPLWGGLGAHELHAILAAIMSQQGLRQGMDSPGESAALSSTACASTPTVPGSGG